VNFAGRKDEVGALTVLFRTGCECARKWGWDERALIRLLRVCWAWERDGEIPESIDDENQASEEIDTAARGDA
jgi:hypothetical protein